jgi:hypothetical protein
MLDIITVVFRDELPVLKLQARSIERYCQNLNLNKIIVVVNDDGLDLLEIDPLWWGEFSKQVILVHRKSWNIAYNNNGWLTQQLLKMLATDLCQSEWSVVLDAKTIFVNPIAYHDVFDSNHLCRTGRLSIPEVFIPSQTIVNQLFGIELTQQIGPGGVPFFFHNRTVQDMISHVESCQPDSFSTWFQNQGMVTEFILYSGFVKYLHGSLDKLYSLTNAIFPCNVCHSEVGRFDQKLKYMTSPNITTVSVHRRGWDQLSQAQQDAYTNFLNSRGIA